LKSSTKKISVIGAGISGLSCAYILKKLGFEVTIYSKDNPLNEVISPTHLSLFPAASIIPHTVSHQNINSIFQHSISCFDKLYFAQFPGLVIHKHFELFAESMEPPSYIDHMKGFCKLNDSELSKAPNHPEITISKGWGFECYFADWSIYFPALIKVIEKEDITIVLKEINSTDLEALESDIIINCAEIGGPLIAGLKPNPILYRGHTIHVKDAPLFFDENGHVVSYNFTPFKSFYKSENGNPQDLYCYPRSDGWILGGSRQIGTLSPKGEWIGEEVIEPSEVLNGIVFPEQILSLQKAILKNSFGLDLDSYKNRTAKAGYRYMGNKKSGLRLESEEKYGKLLVHNYGHGGAGVTLSWGCAIEVASNIIKNLNGKELDIEEVLNCI
tara:strand:- start:4683 stop:5840 length:1158 start_codon:yes stop_codon:yes gene_type:complete